MVAKEWRKLVIAAGFEVGWVIGLKHASTVIEWILTCLAIFISFYLLIASGRLLPVGTAYAVFTGLGATGTVVAEIVLFNEEINIIKLLFIALLVSGIIALKIIDPPKQAEESTL
ncbi:multidrug resistance protein YkkC [Halobacillus andaensis]|uniref:Multidrug resistance protein YkkC n=1 Tax=Halobacillus andaensis TaxID=1176239 RepID=A0A917BAJ6_HALAA|nr:multidrug efflux SMR transporter [Halobacillus andaensis]MBP2005536.1 paired small multidrug resistance pump [Halobacillus andaensis]GGF32246.1 multidrug resistance protein YkkC [Halobacillus andaensis]